MPEQNRLFIGGAWAKPSTGERIEVVSPHSEEVIGSAPAAGPDDVDRAVAAARTAFDTGPWPRTPTAERAALLRRVADLLQRDKDTIARTETLDTGKTLKGRQGNMSAQQFAIGDLKSIWLPVAYRPASTPSIFL